MKCDDVIKMRVGSMDGGSVPAEVDAALERHVSRCPVCRRALRSHEESWALLDADRGIEPSDDFVARTMTAFFAERSGERFRKGLRRTVAAVAAALLLALTLLFFKEPLSEPTGSSSGSGTDYSTMTQGELIENLDLIEDLELLEALGDNLDLAMEYELFLALGGEESVQ